MTLLVLFMMILLAVGGVLAGFVAVQDLGSGNLLSGAVGVFLALLALVWASIPVFAGWL